MHWKKDIMPIHLIVKGLRKPSQKEIEDMKRKAIAMEQKERREREQKIIAMTNSRVWEEFYHNLDESHFRQFERDGIPKWVVDKFMFGFNPKFAVWDWEKSEHIYYQAFTFPSIRRMTIDGKTMNYCRGVRHRLIGVDRDKYRPMIAGLGIDYFQALHKNPKQVIITEGEKKAAVLHAIGFSAIGLWGVEAFQDSWIQEIKRLAPELYVIFDRDGDMSLREMEEVLALPKDDQRLIDPERMQKARIWRDSKNIAEKVGGTAILLPVQGKVDDVIVQRKLLPRDIDAILKPAGKFVIH